MGVLPQTVLQNSLSADRINNKTCPQEIQSCTDDLRCGTRGGSPHTGSRSHSNTLVRASSSSATNGSSSALQKSKHNLITGSRTFKSTAESSFQSTQTVHSSHEEVQNGANNSQSASSSAVQQPNAWNKGPPLSIRSPSSQSVHQEAASKEPTPAESLTQNLSTEVHSSQNHREAAVTTQTATSNAPVTISNSLTESSFAQSVASTESFHRSSSDSSSPSTHAAVSTLSSSVQQMVITSSTDATPVLSANGSSSSIAPVDPQPSMNSSHGSGSGTTYTSQTSGKKFEFNPDAAPFTPRFVNTHTTTPRSTPVPAPTSAVHASHSIHPLSINPTQGISVAQALPTGVITQPGPPFSFTPNANVYSSLPLYYGTQPVIPVGAQIAQVSASSAAAGVTGGPIVAGNTSIPASRTGQVATSAPGSRRTQLFTSYLQNAVSYGPQVIPQYPVNVFATPFQQLSVGSASVPPPTVPPPVSSGGVTVGGTPQPLQIIQAPQQHSQTAYTTRQYYQPSQSYLLATATSASRGYAPQHQSIDYSGNGQQPSSATSSNGNGSNGHNSQPATPGPQPIASPAQVAYSSGTNTPQPTHPVLMPIQSGTSHHPQHMYVQPSSAQFPFVPNGGYMVFNPQQVMQLSAIPSTAQVGLNQASQGLNDAHASNQHTSASQAHGSVPSQQYLNADQSYGQYIHGLDFYRLC
uniref:MI domain-containing protein n=1 Tax=Syphacia muris TaxID=451379 RepID=A0A0N5ABS7_9BILA